MAAGSNAGRCVRCRTWIAAPPVPAGSSTMLPCPVCGHAVVIVPPRDPPPLYTWEVYPQLYGLAPVPRGNPFRWAPGVSSLLWAAAVLLAGITGTLAVVSGASAYAGTTAVSGMVSELIANGTAPRPLAGAQVLLTEDEGARRLAVTDGAGRFSLSGLSPGALTLNVSYPGLNPASLSLFGTPFYSSPNLLALSIHLSATNASASTSVTATSFGDLESFVTSTASSAILLGIGTVAAFAGAISVGRTRIGPGAVAAGVGASVAPGALLVLGLFDPFPILLAPAIAASIFGGTAAALGGAMRWLTGPFEGGEGPSASGGPGSRLP